MRRLVLCAAVFGVGALVTSQQIAFSAVYYEITDLGFGYGYPVINNNLQIAGSRVVDGQVQGLLWEGGIITNLGTLPGENQSAAHGINDAGQIVGGGGAWLWDNGAMTDLGTLPGRTRANANGINNSGQVVGYSYGGGLNDEAFVWQAGVMTGLGTLGYDSEATAINNSSQVVGGSRATYDGNRQPFLWENGVMTNLGVIQKLAFARDINDAGQVVGEGEIATGANHALLWFEGAIVDLGLLPEHTSSYAPAINNHGQIVGQSYGHGQSAVLWEDDQIYDLNDLISDDWSLLRATDINDSGYIVGIGINPDGDRRAFLLTPTDRQYETVIPEPTTLIIWSLLGTLAITVGWWQRRRAS